MIKKNHLRLLKWLINFLTNLCPFWRPLSFLRIFCYFFNAIKYTFHVKIIQTDFGEDFGEHSKRIERGKGQSKPQRIFWCVWFCCHLNQLNRIHLVFNYKKSCEKNLRRKRHFYNTGFREYYFLFLVGLLNLFVGQLLLIFFKCRRKTNANI